jgi:phenylalanyl-tRNA synthetase alpha chain
MTETTTKYAVPKLEDYSPAALDQAARELLAAYLNERNALYYTAEDPDGDPAKKSAALKDFRDRWMARKGGILSQINDGWLKGAPGATKKDVGQKVNEIRTRLTSWTDYAEQHVNFCIHGTRETLYRLRYERKRPEFLQGSDLTGKDLDALIEAEHNERNQQQSKAKLESERIDVTLPGIKRVLGVKHPVLRIMDELVDVFVKMGYSIAEGPEVETDYYNFEALNFPPNHPARDTQDTLFVAGQDKKTQRDRLLLRTHTSPVQIRVMEGTKPPVRVVCPGKVHRNDAADATHFPVFHQVEGLCVDTNITFSDLKGTLDHAMKSLFGSDVKTRFFPSFFPFTEPSADIAISCPFCGGKGCRPCKKSGWIELLGAGMVDPAVFGFVGYDPGKISGFAFGMGVERLAMMKYNVDDIQQFFNGDVRFLEQFA